jgi:hypothetical protein
MLTILARMDNIGAYELRCELDSCNARSLDEETAIAEHSEVLASGITGTAL